MANRPTPQDVFEHHLSLPVLQTAWDFATKFDSYLDQQYKDKVIKEVNSESNMFLNVYSPYNAKGVQLELIAPDEDRIIKVLPHDVLIYEIEQLRKSAAPPNMVAFSTLSDQEKVAYC